MEMQVCSHNHCVGPWGLENRDPLKRECATSTFSAKNKTYYRVKQNRKREGKICSVLRDRKKA